ncbi:quercetin 2,3-dioxygenase [Paramagnetospirillum marisnigri]|uniref:Quercetin 2,3-dioxygenase n=1 Tax=Paramagnetospirillum marisnigri TaxID=1285242 RepID=A0A178MNE6_9PROT|nr:pirin family protein [Paramagnetospirillum marisnigri]OAN50199.1 quercetin 2,3-dioxygenase [Paramagnetospirillum marisnigri]
MTMTLRPADARFHGQHGWLDSRHSFSFAEFHDPNHMGFRALRVINDDWIAPGAGFPTHPHRDMEILTYVTEGGVEHQDSTGGHGITVRGDVQAMTAGTGVRHSEFNASATEPLRLLQIWILPEARSLTPGYRQARFDDADKRDRLRLIASRDGRDGSVVLHQDVAIYASVLSAGSSLGHSLAPGRGAWIQMVRGRIQANGTPLVQGDGAALEHMTEIMIQAEEDSEFLLFDLG